MRSPPRAVRVITLNEVGLPTHSGLLMVEAHTRLVFSVPPNSVMDMSTLLVWTNCPLSPDTPFHRHTYHCLEGTDSDTLDGEWQAFIDLVVPGAFEFFVEFSKAGDAISPTRASQVKHAVSSTRSTCFVEPPAQARRGPISRFVVQPELQLRLLRPVVDLEGPHVVRDYDKTTAKLLPGLANKSSVLYEEAPLPLPLEAITLQTQLTRCLGPIDWWLQLRDSVDAGKFLMGQLAEPLACKFNMLHFTPVQQLGGSNSCYSIADQLMLEPTIFAANSAVIESAKKVVALAGSSSKATAMLHPAVEATKMAVLARMVEVLERQHGALSMVDIVLNHTSTDSWWLRSHPEAGYSLKNSPHLRSAFELDETVLRVSDAIARGTLQGASADMRSDHDVNTALDILKHHSTLGLPAARLWEFYCLDVTGTLGSVVALHPDISLAIDETDTDVSKFNVEGADPSIPEATVRFTPGVEDPELSVYRLHEIFACQHTTVKTVLEQYKSLGYMSGAGDHCFHISDADVERVVHQLMQPEKELDVSEAVARLRAVPASELATENHAAGHSKTASDDFGGQTPVPQGEQTPQITPSYSSADAVSPAIHPTGGFAYGVPPDRAPRSGVAPVNTATTSSTGSSYTQGMGMVPLMTEPTKRRGSGVWMKPPPEYVTKHLRAPSSSSPSLPSPVASVTGLNDHDNSGVFNDGTGSRFAVHVDLERVLAVLNGVLGVRIEPSNWVLPTSSNTSSSSNAWAYETKQYGTLGVLPSLYVIQRVLQAINLRLFQRYDSDIGSALNAVSGTARYQWLSVWQGKQRLSKDRPIVYSYFARIPAAAAASTPAAPKVHVLACNGFIWNGDPEIDFTLPVDAARTYAKLVREGTTQPAYVKRPRGWSKKKQAAVIGVPLDTHVVNGGDDVSSDVSTADASSSHSDDTAGLLSMPRSVVQALGEKVASDGYRALDDAIWGVASQCVRAGAAVPDIDAIPHLRPDVLPLPLANASTPYMRRDIVIWGDCVKLRYGLSPSDSPWLWAYMTVYVRRMARIFQSFRIDNAHGTPLHVAAAMIDAARMLRPSLYVNAELFTGNIDRDVEYVSRLGINSLVRESMQCGSPDELLSCIYSYGGVPLASLRPPLRGQATAARIQSMYAASKAVPLMRKLFSQSQHNLSSNNLLLTDSKLSEKPSATKRNPLATIGGFDITALPAAASDGEPATRGVAATAPAEMLHRILTHVNESRVGAVLPAPLPALFFDCTHDNAVPYEKRHAVDAIANAVLTAAAVCSTGTNRGFDILVPHNISVVRDMRLYDGMKDVSNTLSKETLSSTPCMDLESIPYAMNLSAGILRLRRRLNLLKQEMALRGHMEVFASKHSTANGSDIVTISRGHPSLSSSYLFIARTAFSQYAGNARDHVSLPEITVEGCVTSVVCAASMFVPYQRIRTTAPEGPTLEYPAIHTIRSKACAQGPREESDDGVIRWITSDDAPPHENDAFDANQRVINGLSCDLQYIDDVLGASGDSDPVLGLARFTETDSEGKTVDKADKDRSKVAHTRIHLDAAKFQPGSIIILRVRAPRNVVIRSKSGEEAAGELASPIDAGISFSAGPIALDSKPTVSTHTSGAVPVHRVIDAVGLALHGPVSDNKPFRGSNSSSSLLALLNVDVLRSSDSSTTPLFMAGGDTAPRSNRAGVPRSVPTSTFYGPPLSALENSLLHHNSVTLASLNKLLYRCQDEEMDDSWGSRGVYGLSSGPLAWAGIAGVVPLLRHCRKWNDMGHPLLENVRQGPWLMDYMVGRLGEGAPELAGVREWMRQHFEILKRMPAGLRPQGFDRVVTAVFHVAVAAALMRMKSPLFPGDVYAHSQHYLVSAFEHLSDDDSGEADDFSHSLGADDDGDDGDEEAGAGDFVKCMQIHTDPAAPLPFLTALALVSVQLFGRTRSAPLLAFQNLPKQSQTAVSPTSRYATGAGSAPGIAGDAWTDAAESLAAGVPHFSTGYMRCWGRDTFISLRGLLLTTGRFANARSCILSFASVVRHGLVPNLMDGGKNPRFNCRDAVWWFLQSVRDYCELSPEGPALLQTRIKRRFPSDSMEDYDEAGNFRGPEARQQATLGEIITEILRKHVAGIRFREWNAGRKIDAHMRDEGFNIHVYVDERTGFVHGGNEWNCGTWMDKMGESVEFGTDGIPATPRDGADVEIVALSYSVLTWLATLLATQWHAPTAAAGFTLPSGASLSVADWAAKIRQHFDKCFYVPSDPSKDVHHELDQRYVNTRGIYKDVVGSSSGWHDYQFRPNQLIAMAVAPQLFERDHAASALSLIEQRLLGDHQMGVKTLDPHDWAYRGDYDNSSSADKATAKGWNYHQGPEWLWPFGYYLRARMHFPPEHLATAAQHHAWSSYDAMRRWMFAKLSKHRRYMETCADGGLPELTNADGKVCRDSCTSQAWSAATLLDALFDLHRAADKFDTA